MHQNLHKLEMHKERGEDETGGFSTEVVLFWNWDTTLAKLRKVLLFVDLYKAVPKTNLSFPVTVLAKQNAINKETIFMKRRNEQR
ncbi:25294_t:CDS:2 [Gigaspora rosea]|nr:25294_t:CDS:2 [Gigaspora rosea]